MSDGLNNGDKGSRGQNDGQGNRSESSGRRSGRNRGRRNAEGDRNENSRRPPTSEGSNRNAPKNKEKPVFKIMSRPKDSPEEPTDAPGQIPRHVSPSTSTRGTERSGNHSRSSQLPRKPPEKSRSAFPKTSASTENGTSSTQCEHLFSSDVRCVLKAGRYVREMLLQNPTKLSASQVRLINVAAHVYNNHTDSEARSLFTQILSLGKFGSLSPLVPLDSSFDFTRDYPNQRSISPYDLIHGKDTILKKDNLTTLHVDLFRPVVMYLLHHAQYYKQTPPFDYEGDPCLHIFRANNNFKNEKGDHGDARLESIIASDESLVHYWASWSVIQACAKNKMRSPFGKALESLRMIETSIQNKVQEAIKGIDQQAANSKSILHPVHQAKATIDFFTLLEKHVTTLMDSPANKSEDHSAFFRTNRNTLTEYFVRNRKGLMSLALSTNDPASVWAQGDEMFYLLTQSSNNNSSLAESLLVSLVSALIELRAPEMIEGYDLLAKKHFELECVWMRPAIMEAKCEFERAAATYSFMLDDPNLHNSEQVSAFLAKRSLYCYTHLHDWKGALLVSCKFDVNSFSSLPVKPWMDSKHLQRLSVYDPDLEIDATHKFAHSRLDYEEFIADTEYDLMRMLSNIANHRTRQFGEELMKLAERKIHPLISSAMLSDPSEMPARPLCLLKVCGQIRMHSVSSSTPDKNEAAKVDVDPSSIVGDSLTRLYWLKWLKRLSKLENRFVDSQILLEMELNVCKAACKEGNIHLARTSLINFARSSDAMVGDAAAGQPSAGRSELSGLRHMCYQISRESYSTLYCYQFIYQSAKIFDAANETRTSIEILSESLPKIGNELSLISATLARELKSKSLNLLVKFLQEEMKRNSPSIRGQLINVRRTLQALGSKSTERLPNLDDAQTALCELLLIATRISPTLAKSWSALAGWSYKLGRILDASSSQEDFNLHKNSQASSADFGDYIEYYKLSASSYFRYLHLESRENINGVVATLRLLRIIVKYSSAMPELIQKEISATPTRPWKEIILQLYARLAHPDMVVRQTISQLLCRIGRDSPRDVVFTLVARSMMSKANYFIEKSTAEEGADEMLNITNKLAVLDVQVDEKNALSKSKDNGSDPDQDDEEEDDEDYDDKSESDSIMQNCFEHLVADLAKEEPQLVEETKNLVMELRRITMLWDEMWVAALVAHLGEMRKMVAHLEGEMSIIFPNYTVPIEERNRTARLKVRHFMKRIVSMLLKCYEVTRDMPTTPHELWFQRQFDSLIHETIEKLKNPPDNVLPKPKVLLAAYESLLGAIQTKSLEMNTSRNQLVMSSISPHLSELNSTLVPMPGSSRLISVHKISKIVNILHTKTKPKKISFYGSDGKTYSYLLKGHEDLHLDERVMQFLSVTNMLLDKHSEIELRARNYAVIPLGTKSGLIQWVPSCPALFYYYKKFLSRTDTPCKPIDIFSRKLESHGIKSKNRADWSRNALIGVHEDLRHETPDDLLRSELWHSSVNGSAFWKMCQNFTRSTAVMTVVGYVIGLGDRHLDNILLDPSSGELIHIDYNVCFEKGKALRVPERVPARLTQNIVRTFGVTGVEGPFRIYTESVMKTARQNREILLTLLEAFVYDPLIDWTPQGGEFLFSEQLQQQEAAKNDQHLAKRSNPLAKLEDQLSRLRIAFVKMHDGLLSSLEMDDVDDIDDAVYETAHDITNMEDIIRFMACTLFGVRSDSSDGLVAVVQQKKYRKNPAKLRWIVSEVQKTLLEKMDELRNWLETREPLLETLCGSDMMREMMSIFNATNDLMMDEETSFGPLLHPETHGSPSLLERSQHQQKNTYASSVWRKVKMKLDGRDIDQSRKALPAEQVQMLIRESTDTDNLALMYEGWTSWV